MNVKHAALQSGLPPKTVRYYDEIGLVTPYRQANGYRLYDAAMVQKLAFLKRARNLGFSLDDCRQLLALYEDKSRASADVKALAAARLKAVDERLDELHHLRQTLADLVETCRGDHRPDCPILADIASATSKD